MTYSNGQYNPNPLANPLNTLLGPANYTLNSNGIARRMTFNKNCTTLPQPEFNVQSTDNLHVPHSNEMPLSFSSLQNIIDSYAQQKTWNDREIYSLHGDTTVDKKSIEYWKYANEQNKKMLDNLTDEQKKMLAELNDLFPKSRLEDVN